MKERCGCKIEMKEGHYFPTGIRYCPLHEAAPEMAKALRRLADASAVVGDLDHAGAQVPADAWAELWAANCAARGVIAKTERS